MESDLCTLIHELQNIVDKMFLVFGMVVGLLAVIIGLQQWLIRDLKKELEEK